MLLFTARGDSVKTQPLQSCTLTTIRPRTKQNKGAISRGSWHFSAVSAGTHAAIDRSASQAPSSAVLHYSEGLQSFHGAFEAAL